MKLKQLRIENGLYQKDIASLLNIPLTTYNSYELDRHQPSTDILIKLADYYNVSLDYIMDRPYSKIGFIPDERTTTIKQIINMPDSSYEKVKAYVQAIEDLNNK